MNEISHLPLGHDEAAELLGAFVLDALDDDERGAVAAHVETCPRCRAEVDDHLEIAAMMAGGGPPPAGVWERIEESIAGEAPPIPLFDAPAVRRRRRTRTMVVASMAAAAAVVLFGVLGATVVDQRNRLDDLSGEVAAAREVSDLSEALVDPDTTITELTSPDGELTVRTVLTSDGDSFLIGDSLPLLPSGQTYQLWALLDNEPVSVGLLGADPDLERFHVDGPVRGLMISREPAGGVDQPTSVALVAGEVA